MAMVLRAFGGVLVLATVLTAALQACGNSAVDAEPAVGRVESADTRTKHIPPDAHNDRGIVPTWRCRATCCIGETDGGRTVPYDTTVPFENQLVEWGCLPPTPYKPNPDAGDDNWWFYAQCPMHDPDGGFLGGVDYDAEIPIPGRLTRWVNAKADAGWTNVTPIWSMYPKMDQTCVPMPPPDGFVYVGWDPNCPGGCGITVY